MLKLPKNIPSNPTPPYHFWGRGRGDRRKERETRGDRSTIYSPLTPMEGLILRATPPFSDFLVKNNYYFQIDNDCLIWQISNPSASNIFLFYLRHFYPHPTHIPLNSPSAAGFSDLYGGVCKRGAGVWGGGGCWAQIMSIYTAISTTHNTFGDLSRALSRNSCTFKGCLNNVNLIFQEWHTMFHCSVMSWITLNSVLVT